MNIKQYGIKMEELCKKYHNEVGIGTLYNNIKAIRRRQDDVEIILSLQIDDNTYEIKISSSKDLGFIIDMNLDSKEERNIILTFINKNYYIILDIEKSYREVQNEVMEWMLRNTYFTKYELNAKKYSRKIYKIQLSPFIEDYSIRSGMTILRLNICLDSRFVRHEEEIDIVFDSNNKVIKTINSDIIFEYNEWIEKLQKELE